VNIVSTRANPTALAALCVLLLGSAANAQQTPDTARHAPRDTAAVVDTIGPRPELKPPISPRRAFLYSVLVPGYAQSVLGRNRAGALEIAFEAVALTMVRISAADVREARRMFADSIPVSFVDASGVPKVRFERTMYTESLIRSRRAHLEDWIAVLIGNHLFSGADAFVAANLWDLPTEVSLQASPHAANVAFKLFW
jgi:hypothetical protein